MSKETKKALTRDLVRNILLNKWDPIGIKNREGAPLNEYDRYIDRIIELVQSEGHIEEKDLRLPIPCSSF